MKKYIFAAVFLLLALIIIFTADNRVDAQTETPLSTTSVTAAELPPPQLTTTTVTTFPPTAETTTSAENYAQVVDADLCVIPSGGMNEIFCYEVQCVGESGQNVLVYINAITGQEEQILLLKISQNGTLTV